MVLSSPSSWTVADVEADKSWIYPLSPAEGAGLLAAVRRAGDSDRPILAWRRDDFDLGAAIPTLAAAFREVRDGRGMALVRNLPREGVTPAEFKLMTWAIGLHFGVARPQNRASDYITEVKDAGVTYRSPTGRGYSSNAELDFHVDSSDVVLLSCYNQAPTGGMSMCASAATAHAIVAAERPDYAAALATGYPFSRNGEEARRRGAVVRNAHLQRRGRPGLLQMEPQPHRERPEARGRAAAHPAAARGDGVFRRRAAPAREHVLHAPGAGRPPDPVQPDHAAFAHQLRGPSRTRTRSAPCTGCGWRGRIPGACPRAGRCTTAPSSPARYAAA